MPGAPPWERSALARRPARHSAAPLCVRVSATSLPLPGGKAERPGGGMLACVRACAGLAIRGSTWEPLLRNGGLLRAAVAEGRQAAADHCGTCPLCGAAPLQAPSRRHAPRHVTAANTNQRAGRGASIGDLRAGGKRCGGLEAARCRSATARPPGQFAPAIWPQGGGVIWGICLGLLGGFVFFYLKNKDCPSLLLAEPGSTPVMSQGGAVPSRGASRRVL